jgi:hypothetical protein
MARSRVSETEKLLPEIMALKKSAKEEKISVRYLDGLDGARAAYMEMLKNLKKKPAEKRTVAGFYARTGVQTKEMDLFFNEINEACRRQAVKRQVISVYNQEMLGRYLSQAMAKKYLVQVKAIREEFYSSNISIEAYDNFVQIFSQRLMQIIIIEDADIAAAIRHIFTLVWDLVEKNKEEYLGFESV